MDELEKLLGSGALYGGGALGTIAAGIYMLRKYLSGDRAERSVNDTTVAASGATTAAIELLQTMLADEIANRREAEQRADQFAKERNDAISEVGQLRAEVKFLREQVETATREIALLRGTIERKNP